MKLTLEHLAGYLPYKVRFLSTTGKEAYWTENGAYYGHRTSFGGSSTTTIHFNTFLRNYKPVLRPLSDLTKEIEINGEKFVPINQFNRESRQQVEKELSITHGNLICDFLNYETIKKLLQWHFDIHGLIEKELAIDINTI